ncbi:hypothetical protein E4T42_03205 [Aureobasidium subglaciale]|nr:hypothetical protein E4T42_03205 [Aureobasidium subglaciale]
MSLCLHLAVYIIRNVAAARTRPTDYPSAFTRPASPWTAFASAARFLWTGHRHDMCASAPVVWIFSVSLGYNTVITRLTPLIMRSVDPA